MKVAVAGLWHLGTVTAACLASAGHTVTAFDDKPETITELEEGRLPVFEPGLQELIAQGVDEGRLRFTRHHADLAGSDIIWITYDTPVDEGDHADVEFVVNATTDIFPFVGQGTLVLISSQLPAGSTRRLEDLYRQRRPDGTATFAYSPENLRLGGAIQAFVRPERVVAGIRSDADKNRIADLFRPFTDQVEWMTVESAEMTKHALNAFLATSVTFANEVATLCERVGADAREVERGLRSDVRIGPKAYVRPGAAFAGGTLARDVVFLMEMGRRERLPTHLMSAVQDSNEAHKHWPQRRLTEILGDVGDKRVAILGLTYKPGTNTLRGSSALHISQWLGERGARVTAYDPAVKTVPAEIEAFLDLRPSAGEALQGADAALVATEWPEFRSLAADDLVRWMRHPIVLDPTRFLPALGTDTRIRYLSVGRAA